jgi:hypothetical protein
MALNKTVLSQSFHSVSIAVGKIFYSPESRTVLTEFDKCDTLFIKQRAPTEPGLKFTFQRGTKPSLAQRPEYDARYNCSQSIKRRCQDFRFIVAGQIAGLSRSPCSLQPRNELLALGLFLHSRRQLLAMQPMSAFMVAAGVAGCNGPVLQSTYRGHNRNQISRAAHGVEQCG